MPQCRKITENVNLFDPTLTAYRRGKVPTAGARYVCLVRVDMYSGVHYVIRNSTLLMSAIGISTF
jgi:hypothetical protein